mmetsp:Transcript_35988/g.75557  ORF Transcript_35988/g.75557 Transcript_35988/m.75557 type:complete len:86 (+) Transcript_35988:725-982(+)
MVARRSKLTVRAIPGERATCSGSLAPFRHVDGRETEVDHPAGRRPKCNVGEAASIDGRLVALGDTAPIAIRPIGMMLFAVMNPVH